MKLQKPNNRMIPKGQVSQYGARLPLAHFFAARKGIHPRIFQKFIFQPSIEDFFLKNLYN